MSQSSGTIRVHIDHADAVAMGTVERPSLVLDIIEDLTQRRIEVVSRAEDAALSLIYPYGVLDSWRRSNDSRSVPPYGPTLEVLRDYIVTRSITRPLFISHENLEHPRWAWLGQELRETSIPRLTYWPRDLDEGGERLPYWWNYVDWPELSRRRRDYPRYGRLYSLDRLMSPLPIDASRDEKAVLVAAHMPFPRGGAVRLLSSWIDVDLLGGDVTPVKHKLEILRRYRYAVVTENSLGVGYCTEKVPEAWDAGCAPLGYLQPPSSDFTLPPETLQPCDIESVFLRPLLSERPRLDRLKDYIGEILG